MKDRIKGLFFKPGRFHAAEIYLMIVLFVFGGLACFFLPVNGGYDEEEHLIRVWEMAHLTFLPNEKLGNELPFPMVYRELSYRRDFIVRAVPKDFWEEYGSLSLDSMDYVYDVDTRSVFFPPLLLPQALVMRFLGLNLQLPALTVYYACRLAELLSYIFLTVLAVRLVPYGKWILAILASSPVAILQSATISPDSISNGIAFLFIGGCLAIAARKEIRWRELILLTLLVLILFWGKVNIVPLVLLPFLIIRPARFTVRYGYVILLVIMAILFVVEVAGWNLFAYARYPDALSGADPGAQAKFILGGPFHFMGILLHDIWLNSRAYLNAWTAIYGLDYWPVPTLVYYLYWGGLLGVLLLKENENAPDSGTRIGLVITFIATALWTIVTLYLSYTPARSELVLGVQGRYFIGVMPLLFLALACLPFLNQIRIPRFLPFTLGGLSLVLYIGGMYLSYHVNCGSQYYTGGLCYQPNYKNWAPNELYSPSISSHLDLKQEIIAECSGMTEFRVWVNAADADPNGKTNFILRDASDKRDVFNVSASNADLPSGDWFTLTFQPDWTSDGKLYILTIQSDQDSIGAKIAYSLKQEYLVGKLYENEQAIDKDLIFQMGCIAGWEKTNLIGWR